MTRPERSGTIQIDEATRYALRHLIKHVDGSSWAAAHPAWFAAIADAIKVTHVTVVLFKDTGKYYTEELWRIPDNAIGPYDMVNSPDFHTIAGGPVLIESQEPWGYPHLIVS